MKKGYISVLVALAVGAVVYLAQPGEDMLPRFSLAFTATAVVWSLAAMFGP